MVLIRAATGGDAQALLAIRNHYVLHGHAVFDETPLTLNTIADWTHTFKPTGPHQLLVAVDAGEVTGFACSQTYRPHPAFRTTVETSIYAAPGHAGAGLGSRLYTALFDTLRDEDLHRAVVGIALPNPASVRLHEKFGFTVVGVFDEYAKKQGRYISSVWMQKQLRASADTNHA